MAFIAECPFCKLKLQKVPETHVGGSTECPRCRNVFTLAPMIAPPKVLHTVTMPELGKNAPTSRGESATSTAVTTIRPPSPAASGARKPGLTVVTRGEDKGPAPLLAEPEAPPVLRRPGSKVDWSVLGVLGFLSACVGLLAASFQQLGAFTVPLSAIGLGLGILSLWRGAVNRQPLAFSLACLVVSAPVLIVALVDPSLIGLPARQRADSSPHASLVYRPLGKQDSGKVVTDNEESWFDVSQGSLQKEDVRLLVSAATLRAAPAGSRTGKKGSGERYLSIKVVVKNVGVSRSIAFTSWGQMANAAQHVRLVDQTGRVHKLHSLTSLPGTTSKSSILPGKQVEDNLAFDPPSAKTAFLRLELPASAVGLPGTFRLEIPWAMIKQ